MEKKSDLIKECLQEEIGILKFNEFLLHKIINIDDESIQRAKKNKSRAECKVELLKKAYADERFKEL